jgi:RNA polymerase sigma-70 factor (ECF subfamily)
MDDIVTRWYGRLYGFAFRMLGDRDLAEDVAQQALILAYRHAARFRPDGRVATWLLAIATNLARTEASRRSRRATIPWEAHPEPEAPGDVEQTALRRLEGERVFQALAALSPEHRLVVTLFYYEGLSHAEIAHVCGCAVGTAKSRLHYALARLRRLLCSVEPETNTAEGEWACP